MAIKTEEEILTLALRKLSEVAQATGRRSGEKIEIGWGADLGYTKHRNMRLELLLHTLVIRFREVWNEDLCFYRSELIGYVAGDPHAERLLEDALRVHLEALLEQNRREPK